MDKNWITGKYLIIKAHIHLSGLSDGNYPSEFIRYGVGL